MIGNAFEVSSSKYLPACPEFDSLNWHKNKYTTDGSELIINSASVYHLWLDLISTFERTNGPFMSDFFWNCKRTNFKQNSEFKNTN